MPRFTLAGQCWGRLVSTVSPSSHAMRSQLARGPGLPGTAGPDLAGAAQPRSWQSVGRRNVPKEAGGRGGRPPQAGLGLEPWPRSCQGQGPAGQGVPGAPPACVPGARLPGAATPSTGCPGPGNLEARRGGQAGARRPPAECPVRPGPIPVVGSGRRPSCRSSRAKTGELRLGGDSCPQSPGWQRSSAVLPGPWGVGAEERECPFLLRNAGRVFAAQTTHLDSPLLTKGRRRLLTAPQELPWG